MHAPVRQAKLLARLLHDGRDGRVVVLANAREEVVLDLRAGAEGRVCEGSSSSSLSLPDALTW